MQRFPQRAEEPTSLTLAAEYSVDLARISGDQDALPHALFAPLHYESNYAYPLIVWLHGPGDDEYQLRRVMPNISMRNYVAIAPRGTDAVCDRQGRESFRWHQSSDQILAAEQRVLAAVDLAEERYHIAPNRIFVAGFQSGGSMAFRMALHHPDRFAGALGLGGPFPRDHQPLRRLKELRNLPLFLATCVEGRHYPQAQVCEDLRLFHSAGLSVTLRQYPCADELTTLMLGDMNRWIMEHVCSGSSQG